MTKYLIVFLMVMSVALVGCPGKEVPYEPPIVEPPATEGNVLLVLKWDKLVENDDCVESETYVGPDTKIMYQVLYGPACNDLTGSFTTYENNVYMTLAPGDWCIKVRGSTMVMPDDVPGLVECYETQEISIGDRKLSIPFANVPIDP